LSTRPDPVAVSWTQVYRSADELIAAFAARPAARYRPVPLWWWSGAPLDADRLDWQLDRIAELGCGAFAVTGLALHGPAVGTSADQPPGFSPAWLALFRRVCERAERRGLKVITWSPLQIGGPAADANRLLRRHPEWRGELIRDGRGPEPYGFDYTNPEAIAGLVGPGTRAGDYLAAVDDLLGSTIVGLFEDEFPLFPAWAPDFAADFRTRKGYDPDPSVMYDDIGPRTPALRWDLFDVATSRAEGSYTRYLDQFVRRHDLLAGFDEMNRSGDPVSSTLCYFDPFRTMRWASAPGTDHMGDARFPMSLAAVTGAPRVWLEGFHSHGWGMTLDHQMRLLFEWAREGATVFLPHGFYYATQAFWFEWAPPEMGWRQPYARHYPVFADAVGRLMAAMSAGRHLPEVAVLYPTSTMWAATNGHRSLLPEGEQAAASYRALFGVHDTPSAFHPEEFRHPSLLAEAGYDRIAVDEAHADCGHVDPVGAHAVPLIVADCVCLRTDTVRRLADQAEGGRLVIVVGAVPRWSAEHGRDDPAFTAEVDRLLAAAVPVPTPADVLAVLPPPRVAGLRSQWRRVGDLDLVLVTGTGSARLRGCADRQPRQWDVRTGTISALPARRDAADLVLDLPGPAALISLPPGPPTDADPAAGAEPATDVATLPTEWACEYVPFGENRWGDYVLPANEGPPPTQRRTFAFREGDDPAWRSAPVTPEDVEHPFVDVGFEEHMGGATGRPRPANRWLGGQWREVVATYGAKATVDGVEAEYSERLGIEDGPLSTQIGLKGRVEPVKVDLGATGAGTIRSFGWVPGECATHLVLEGHGIVSVWLDGVALCSETELGVLSVPVQLAAGWHELRVRLEPRVVADSPLAGYIAAARSQLSWVFAEPYRRSPTAIWGGSLIHPDYKAASGPRRFRRRLRLDAPMSVRWEAYADQPVAAVAVPEHLPAGEHVLEWATAGELGTPYFAAVLELTGADPDRPHVLRVTTDAGWETAGADGNWEGVFPIGAVWAPPAERLLAEAHDADPFAHPLTDVAWLHGPEAVTGQLPGQLWADAPTDPPPAWFAFTAGPGATALTLPIVGTVDAFVAGEPTTVQVDATGQRWIPLREHSRVALRVQAPPGRRGAACFTEPPRLTLGPGTLRMGISWHRQGLDSFSGVIVARTEYLAPEAGPAWLELDDLIGSVRVSINGVDAGVLAWAPWRLPVELTEGRNLIELELANTLGPLAARGVPTPFAPEHQRRSGVIGDVRIVREVSAPSATAAPDAR
jgi:hypothetical protein